MRSARAERTRTDVSALGTRERELGEAQDRGHRRLQLVRHDGEELLAVTVPGGDGGEPGIECVGQDGDFVAPLFEHALVDAELLEPLDLPNQTLDSRSNSSYARAGRARETRRGLGNPRRTSTRYVSRLRRSIAAFSTSMNAYIVLAGAFGVPFAGPARRFRRSRRIWPSVPADREPRIDSLEATFHVVASPPAPRPRALSRFARSRSA